MSEMAEPVAEIRSENDRFRYRLYDDWSWRPAPGAISTPSDLRTLEQLGRYGHGVANFADTARAAAGLLYGEVVRWWGDYENDRERALHEAVGVDGDGPLGPIP